MFSIAEQEEGQMKKNALALAVGALFAAPAVQAQMTMGNETVGTVQVYGKLYPQFATSKGFGSSQVGTEVSNLVSSTGVLTAGIAGATFVAAEGRIPDHNSRNTVDSQNSYVGFRGERKLGERLKAIWQVEQSVELDTGTGAWSNRNSFAGLSHGVFGTVKLGNMDTIYKEYGDTFAMFGIASGNFISASNVLSNIGIGSSNTARFHERRANSIQYQTAEFAGFQAGLQYGPDEARGEPGTGLNRTLWSYGVKWDSQMFYGSLSHEVHYDTFGASTNIPDATVSNTNAGARSKDSASRATGEVRFANQRIVVDVARLHYVETGQLGTGRFAEYRKPTWAVGYDINLGPWGLATQYVRAGSGSCQRTGGADCNTNGLASWMLSLGARYRFDRQTFLYLIANKLSNGPSARHDNWAATTPNRGEDVKQVAAGISYSF
jgi:predicted porin